VKTFGSPKMTWASPIDNNNHVLVAVARSGWQNLCMTRPEYYSTVEAKPRPTAEPVVWDHDRAEVTCPACLAMVDGAAIEFVPAASTSRSV
jgi:hypothetical protein